MISKNTLDHKQRGGNSKTAGWVTFEQQRWSVWTVPLIAIAGGVSANLLIVIDEIL